MRRTSAIAVAVIAAAGVAMSPTSFFVAEAERTATSAVFEPEGANHDCLELVPDEASPNAFLGGGTVNLHVRLVLDFAESRGLDATVDNPATSVNERQAAINAFGQDIAKRYLAAGKQSYSAIDVTLDYASFDVLKAADLKSGTRAAKMEGQAAINLAKQQYGGTRPAGTDVVYVLTDRDLTSGGNSGLAGLADCIGGVHHGSTAFATGEFDPDAAFTIGVKFYAEYTAKVAAHEVGHLMGAHHHYQACGPYAATNYAAGYGAGACTLMTNFVDFVTFPFSPTNQAVVRGHAEKYAFANDEGAGQGQSHPDEGESHPDEHGH